MTTNGYRLLLVDDDPGLLRLLSIRLAAVGYAVATVESGEAALVQLPRYCPHLVITDLKMNGMDGMTLFSRIHTRYPELPVMILTAHGSKEEGREAIRRGVFSYMSKPFDSKTLLEHVSVALNQASGESCLQERL